ncbi:MAG: 23S rRNA pseudouridine1911/1915/1917 synthase [Bacteriovoracaceae bacterium]|jgi:23S rRNA pseudouridine1911/1915/1917 synthase
MKISISLIQDLEDLYQDLLKPLGLSKSQYKKSGMKKNLSFKKGALLELPVDLLRNGEVNPIYEGNDIEILSEDQYFIVLSKPFGIHGHPQSYAETETVLNFLNYKKLCPAFGGAERGLLYRLDKETSGVLILAKDETVFNELRDNFSELAKEKIYIAIVEGKLTELGEKRHFLKGSEVKGSKQKESTEGSEARLSIISSFYNSEKDCSLVKIKLETGLRHQIRAQLSIEGFPILGDELYGGNKEERIYLHAYNYSLEYKGDRYSYEDKTALLFDKFFDLDSCL